MTARVAAGVAIAALSLAAAEYPGALAQSRAGRRYESILHFYYSGIELVRL